MTLLILFTVFLSALGCMAQRSLISNPTAGTTVSPGQKLNIQVIRPNSIMGSTEVGMVIGLLQCQQNPCPSPDSQVGSIVFNGDYKPILHELPGQPYENFTVTVPNWQPNFGTNQAQLTTARFHLIGAGPSPVLELNNVALNIVFK